MSSNVFFLWLAPDCKTLRISPLLGDQSGSKKISLISLFNAATTNDDVEKTIYDTCKQQLDAEKDTCICLNLGKCGCDSADSLYRALCTLLLLLPWRTFKAVLSVFNIDGVTPGLVAFIEAFLLDRKIIILPEMDLVAIRLTRVLVQVAKFNAYIPRDTKIAMSMNVYMCSDNVITLRAFLGLQEFIVEHITITTMRLICADSSSFNRSVPDLLGYIPKERLILYMDGQWCHATLHEMCKTHTAHPKQLLILGSMDLKCIQQCAVYIEKMKCLYVELTDTPFEYTKWEAIISECPSLVYPPIFQKLDVRNPFPSWDEPVARQCVQHLEEIASPLSIQFQARGPIFVLEANTRLSRIAKWRGTLLYKTSMGNPLFASGFQLHSHTYTLSPAL
jgi:hypothetical protein